MFGFPVWIFLIVALAEAWAWWMFNLLGKNGRYQLLRWFYVVACIVGGLGILIVAMYEWWNDAT